MTPKYKINDIVVNSANPIYKYQIMSVDGKLDMYKFIVISEGFGANRFWEKFDVFEAQTRSLTKLEKALE